MKKKVTTLLYLVIAMLLVPPFVFGGTTNIALGKKVTATTNSQVGTPSEIVDGLYDNVWYSYQGSPTEQEFLLDLGALYTIGQVDMHVAQIYGVSVSTSTDGTLYTERFNRDGESYAGVLSFSGDGAYMARYIKYHAYANWAQYVGISEIEVWADTSTDETEGVDPPDGIKWFDLTETPSDAMVKMGNIVKMNNVMTLNGKMELTVNFPAYNKPVDIWILIALPDGRFYVADQSGKVLSFESNGLVPIASGVSGTTTIKQILAPFETGTAGTPFTPWPDDGEWTAYWLIAPESNGDIMAAIAKEDYQLGFYTFEVKSATYDDINIVDPEKGGIITLSDGAAVSFPAGCSDSEISTIFTNSSDTTDRPENESIRTISGEYKLVASSSTAIRSDVSISIPVDQSLLPVLPEGFTESDRRVFLNLEFYNDQAAEWQRYGSLLFYDGSSGLVTVPVSLPDFAGSKNSMSKNRQSERFSDRGLREINISEGGVKYRVTHLTDYGMKIVQQEGSPFKFVYYTCMAQLKDSVACLSESVPGASSDPDVDDYIELLDKVLQEAYTKLTNEAVDQHGNHVFAQLSTPQKVIVKDLGPGSEGETIIGGPMVIDNDRPTGTLGGLSAHELTHVFQGQYYSGISTLNSAALSRWFVEGTADHYSELVFPAPSDSPDKNFLSVPLDASDQLSYYSVKFFLRWLGETYGDKIVGDALRWRQSPNGSLYDTINLSNAIGENGSFVSDSLETAFEKYCIYVMQNPDISPNSSIKSYMEMFLTQDENGSKIYTYLTNPDITFNTAKTYFKFTKKIKGLSAAYLSIWSQHPDSVKLVIAPVSKSGETNTTVKSMTYVGKGGKQSDYEAKNTVESQNSINPPYLSDKAMSAKSIKQGTLVEHMLYNQTHDKSMNVNMQYYILAPPQITQVGQGTTGGIIVWSTKGIGTLDAIPRALIKGYDLYDKEGKKLNSTMVPLPSTVDSDQSFESPAVIAGDSTDNYTVVIEDVYGNRWPEVEPAEICLRYQEVAGTNGAVMKDSETELEWQRCSVGQTWDPTSKSCEGTVSLFNATDAFNLTMEGGWRTPTTYELGSLVYCTDDTFPVDRSWFWTSSWWEMCVGDQCQGYPYAMNNEESKMADVSNLLPVRLVKSPY